MLCKQTKITTQTYAFRLVTMVIKYFNEWCEYGGLQSSLIVDIDTIFYVIIFWFGFTAILFLLT